MRVVRRFPGGVTAAVVTVILSVVGCSGGPLVTSAGPLTPPAGASSSWAGTPAFATSLQPKLAAKMRELRVPGAIMLVDVPGQGSWQTSMGVGNIDTNTLIRTTDHMRIGSVTKTFTATVVLQLVDEHKLGLDDPIGRYVPQVPNGANITVRQLLNMTSGLFNITEDDRLNRSVDAQPEKVWTDEEQLPIAFTHPPYFPPGDGFHYSNTNYLLLGMIAEQVGGAPLAELMRQRIFDRLGMRDTMLPPRGSTAIPEPHQRGYTYGSNVELNTAYHAAQAGDKAAAEVKAAPDAKPTDATKWSTSVAYAAGAAISTVNDMRIWAKALTIGQMLSAPTQRERLQFGTERNYGLGVDRSIGGLIGHNGAVPGFQTFVGYQPYKGVTVIVLTNLGLAPNTYLDKGYPADEMAKLIQQEVLPGP
jgi:D-alanyl-D-alanine carboxypeptidase